VVGEYADLQFLDLAHNLFCGGVIPASRRVGAVGVALGIVGAPGDVMLQQVVL